MNATIRERMRDSCAEITDHLENGIIRFWLENGIDGKCGGYTVNIDKDGVVSADADKYIVTQTRMIWGFSALYGEYPSRTDLRDAAKQGVDFFIRHFWDAKHGGWYWSVARDGSPIDTAKIVYGQSFAIYALAEYTRVTRDPRGLEYAERTFDLLQKYCADTRFGGYFENLENDWTISEKGFAAGDRKSLDIHMHLMEAFTTLFQCSGREIHGRKLDEVISLILDRMVNEKSGCGMNQFDVGFNPIPAINIKRTWNAERTTGEIIEKPTDTTSYGHNIELIWLLNRADEALGKPGDLHDGVARRLADHAIAYGLDANLGGVYRDGPHEGPAYVTDKEWWQNCEALIGFLDAYEHLGKDEYFDAFRKIWSFDKKYFINEKIGEWRQLLDRNGTPISADIGNPWKAIYHTGRAMLECKHRLSRLLAT
jgi:cellobiose epimerase